MDRTATVTRETAETSVDLAIDLDGEGASAVETGIGFFDHMLAALAAHALVDLEVSVDGDTEVDDHHTVEDTALAFGRAVDEALGDRAGIVRFADRRVPLDEAVASVVVDVSGRPLCRFDGSFSADRVGEFTASMAPHFLRSVATEAGLTVHASVCGGNAHHEVEALFKCFARTLDDATRIDDRREGPPSTKGTL